MEDKKTYDEIEHYYQLKGIVTRNEVKRIDYRTFGRTIMHEMKKRGHSESRYVEVFYGQDYSGILFNSNFYSVNFAEEYLKKNVLKNYQEKGE